MYHYPNASKGMKQFFIGIILEIAAIPLTLILIGPIVAVVAVVMQLIGLRTAAQDDNGYYAAFQASIAMLILNVITNFVQQNGTAVTLLSMVSSLVSLYVTYQVITITCLLLQGKDSETIAKGQTVLKIYVGTTIVSIVCSLLVLVRVLGAMAAIVSVISAIVSFVGYILFMVFLHRAYQSLA